jgi:hypothetical protein
MAARGTPGSWNPAAGGWSDEGAWTQCQRGRDELSVLATGLERDPEVGRVRELWDRYCSRYDRPRSPVRRETPGPAGWPSARSGG